MPRQKRPAGNSDVIAALGFDDEITTFDSTGLAIQDLAIAIAALERADDLDLPTLDL